MYEILVVAGVILFITQIVAFVKLCQMSNDIRAIKNLYVDFKSEFYDANLIEEDGVRTTHRYYKNPLNEISKEEWDKSVDDFIKKTNNYRKQRREMPVDL